MGFLRFVNKRTGSKCTDFGKPVLPENTTNHHYIAIAPVIKKNTPNVVPYAVHIVKQHYQLKYLSRFRCSQDNNRIMFTTGTTRLRVRQHTYSGPGNCKHANPNSSDGSSCVLRYRRLLRQTREQIYISLMQMDQMQK